MLFRAEYPDGRSEILLNVPRFDFAWQIEFWLAEPIRLPKGAKLHVTAHFDNSPANANNPDPKATVRWAIRRGKMMIGYFTCTVDTAAMTSSKNQP